MTDSISSLPNNMPEGAVLTGSSALIVEIAALRAEVERAREWLDTHVADQEGREDMVKSLAGLLSTGRGG